MKIHLELPYLPPIAYLALVLAHDEVILEQEEHYQKRTYRNRCHIASVNGLLRLSIPLKKGKNQQQPIRTVRIAYQEPWQAQHWQSIRSAYGKAPFFEDYAPFFESIFQQRYEFLFEFNAALFQQILAVLQIQPSIRYTSVFNKEAEEHTIDARNYITPQKIRMPVGTNYRQIYYPQVFSEKTGFIPDLTILDLIFCTGPQAILILEQSIRSQ